MGRFFGGLFFLAAGCVMIIFTEKLMEWFGRIAWAEDKLGAEGGTRIFYKLLGFGFIILAFMIWSGKVFSILEWLFVRDNQ